MSKPSENSPQEKENRITNQKQGALQSLPGDYKSVLERLKVCFIVVIAYALLNLFHIGCPIKDFSGISCPGCGMTRAVISALLLHFDQAFYYHPLFFLTPVMFLLYLFDNFIKKNVKGICWTIIIILFFAVYFYRLFFTVNDVVTIDIWSGRVLKLLHKIIVWEGLHD
jgi:hypothetical protein